jgi:hypothetical protein
MTGIDEIVNTIEVRAAGASDGAGMTERVQAAAARIRRRRRVTAVVATAAVVVAAAAAIPVTARLRADPGLPAATHYRDPGQLTAAAAEGSAYSWRVGVNGSLQWMSPSQGGSRGSTCCAATVRVYDPGSYDATELKNGDEVEVGGHRAWYGTTHITAPTEPPEIDYDGTADFEVATLGWQDASGAWVTVVNGQDAPPQFLVKGRELRDQMFAIAADVRLTAPRDTLVPMHFPAIPGNLPVSFAYADTRDYDSGQQATLGFGGSTGVPLLYLGGSSTTGADAPLEISAWTTTLTPWTELMNNRGYQATTIAGHPARYRAGKDGGSLLLVDTGSCGIEVKVAQTRRITLDDLNAMFTGATFDRCDSTATWTRPLN